MRRDLDQLLIVKRVSEEGVVVGMLIEAINVIGRVLVGGWYGGVEGIRHDQS